MLMWSGNFMNTSSHTLPRSYTTKIISEVRYYSIVDVMNLVEDDPFHILKIGRIIVEHLL
jgi:hypothetical protein